MSCCGSIRSTTHFHPETSQAALDVLARAGLQRRRFPRSALCCGRPLYDFGLLDQAKAYLQHDSRRRSRTPIDAGVPIVVLEPSCASVFRDELRNLFPADARAERLRRQTFLLSEFLEAGARLRAADSSRARSCCTATAITRR